MHHDTRCWTLVQEVRELPGYHEYGLRVDRFGSDLKCSACEEGDGPHEAEASENRLEQSFCEGSLGYHGGGCKYRPGKAAEKMILNENIYKYL